MTEPCQQANRLETVDQKLDRLTEVLTTVAVQKAEIEHLVAMVTDMKEWVHTLEKRMQAVEQMPGQSATKFLWVIVSVLTSSILASIATLLVSHK